MTRKAIKMEIQGRRHLDPSGLDLRGWNGEGIGGSPPLEQPRTPQDQMSSDQLPH